ncbi:hypothetical protein LCGC14_1466700, partial [marine sediment metagenome]
SNSHASPYNNYTEDVVSFYVVRQSWAKKNPAA